MVIDVTMGVSSASNSPSMMTLQEALEEAVLYFMLGPPQRGREGSEKGQGDLRFYPEIQVFK